MAEWAKVVSAVNTLVRVGASSRHEINWFHPMRLAVAVRPGCTYRTRFRSWERGRGCAEIEVSFSFPPLGGVLFFFFLF